MTTPPARRQTMGPRMQIWESRRCGPCFPENSVRGGKRKWRTSSGFSSQRKCRSTGPGVVQGGMGMWHLHGRGGLTWELGHKAPVRMYLGGEKNEMLMWKENSEVSSRARMQCTVAAQLFGSHCLRDVMGLSSILERPFWKQRRAYVDWDLGRRWKEAEARETSEETLHWW